MEKKDIIRSWRTLSGGEGPDLIPAIPGGIRELSVELLEELNGGTIVCGACSSGTLGDDKPDDDDRCGCIRPCPDEPGGGRNGGGGGTGGGGSPGGQPPKEKDYGND